jgi:hypothetical protein
MGLSFSQDQGDSDFLKGCGNFISEQEDMISEIMNPEEAFIITEDNKKKIKLLLVNLQKEKLLEDESNTSTGSSGSEDLGKLIETFTNMLFEALQFVNIIPNVLIGDMQNEMEELRKVAEAFNHIKNNLIDFKNIVA